MTLTSKVPVLQGTPYLHFIYIILMGCILLTYGRMNGIKIA